MRTSHAEQLGQDWVPTAANNGLLRTNGTLRASTDPEAQEFGRVLQLTKDESNGAARSSFGLTQVSNCRQAHASCGRASLLLFVAAVGREHWID